MRTNRLTFEIKVLYAFSFLMLGIVLANYVLPRNQMPSIDVRLEEVAKAALPLKKEKP